MMMITYKTVADDFLCMQVFMHVSTAFCHVDVPVLGEKVYETPISPADIMRLCSFMDEQTLDIITPRYSTSLHKSTKELKTYC